MNYNEILRFHLIEQKCLNHSLSYLRTRKYEIGLISVFIFIGLISQQIIMLFVIIWNLFILYFCEYIPYKYNQILYHLMLNEPEKIDEIFSVVQTMRSYVCKGYNEQGKYIYDYFTMIKCFPKRKIMEIYWLNHILNEVYRVKPELFYE